MTLSTPPAKASGNLFGPFLGLRGVAGERRKVVPELDDFLAESGVDARRPGNVEERCPSIGGRHPDFAQLGDRLLELLRRRQSIGPERLERHAELSDIAFALDRAADRQAEDGERCRCHGQGRAPGQQGRKGQPTALHKRARHLRAFGLGDPEDADAAGQRLKGVDPGRLQFHQPLAVEAERTRRLVGLGRHRGERLFCRHRARREPLRGRRDIADAAAQQRAALLILVDRDRPGGELPVEGRQGRREVLLLAAQPLGREEDRVEAPEIAVEIALRRGIGPPGALDLRAGGAGGAADGGEGLAAALLRGEKIVGRGLRRLQRILVLLCPGDRAARVDDQLGNDLLGCGHSFSPGRERQRHGFSRRREKLVAD